MRLPIDEVLPRLLAALAERRVAVLTAPTGAGKTTRVPPALLDGGLAGDGAVVMLEPRRLAARAAARRMAAERGVGLGDEVGYRVRFDSRVSSATRLEVVTEGLFLRRLADDPFLEGVGLVIFDEFHERHLDGDLALALVRRLREDARPDLGLLVMSATLEAQALAAALDAPVVASEGRLHPVDVRYLPPGLELRLDERVARGVRAVVDETDGDVLVFLPGVGAIRRSARALAGLAAERDLDLLELYGDLSPERQDAVLAPSPRRKLVLATNVAETSVTIPGVTAVVDSGLAAVPSFDPAVGLDRLEVVPVSVASTDQRAGRAGRTAPGVCARLWTAAEQRNRPATLAPEIARLDLSGAVLQILDGGEPDPAALPWLDPPPPAQLTRARELLTRLGALADGRLTRRGRALARLPVAPRLGALLLSGDAAGLLEECALAAALLSERDPWQRREPARHVSDSDLADRLDLLEAGDRGVSRGAVQSLRQVARQLARLVPGRRAGGRDDGRRAGGRDDGSRRGGGRTDRAALGRALLAAFPDRVARRREPGSPRGLMVGGRGVRLEPGSAVSEAPLFLCLDLRAGGGGEARVRLACAVERSWLDELGTHERTRLRFDPGRQAVVASRQELFEDLVLAEHPGALDDPERTAALLAEAAAAEPAAALDLDDPDYLSLRERLACLADWCPDLELPGADEPDLLALLPQLCLGRRSFAELRRVSLADELAGRLTHEQRQALERLAPERLQVPSGSRLALTYERGRPPVLAVRIQEMFGCRETPRVAGGRVPVLLHLLAPNLRPQQVTDDLAGFWERTYPLVRKELRRRYSKHAWPEDPLAAEPRSRPGRRRPGTS